MISTDAGYVAAGTSLRPQTGRTRRVGSSSRPRGQWTERVLNRVPTKRTGKRSRHHVDLYTGDRYGELQRLVALGATRYPWRYRPNSDFVVLEDTDGNLFCVVQHAGSLR